MSATALKERLRADLKAALQARASDDVRALRTLIAALDDAEAVPGEYAALPRAFGDPSGEVARRELDADAVEAVLANEVDARLAAASDYERHGRGDKAARLRDEAALVARYREA
jgi:uncharacterized protein YqeY